MPPRRRRKKSHRSKHGKSPNSQCCSCGARSYQRRGDLLRAAGVRCDKCGGRVHLSRYVTPEAPAPRPAPVAPRAAPDSDGLAAFLELVDCDASEVQDANSTPPTVKPAGSRAAARTFDAKRFGDRQMPFGKHRGRRIRQIPRNYLSWLAEAIGTSQDADRFKGDLRRWLAAPETPPNLNDALSVEYRQIIGPPPQQRSA
jgi:hypothetical protein